MTVLTGDYIYLSKHAYGDMDVEFQFQKDVVIKKEKSALSSDYKILEIAENKLTGYQGAIYRNQNTGELVAVHRGTEMTNGVPEFMKDTVIADGAMVLKAVNTQIPDAMCLMARAKQLAESPEYCLTNGKSAPISTTGHSLGGFLAQYTAYHFGVSGETFNAYGAVGLYGIKETHGAHGMINHMRATDFVSAANGHFGEVRVYAKAEDIDALSQKGAASPQQGSAGFLYDVVANVNAHKMGDSFWPPEKSVISDENRQRYHDNARTVDAFRDDMRSTREVTTFGSQFMQALHLDPGAIKHLATQPLPKMPDHIERSVINAATKPAEASLELAGNAINAQAKTQGVVTEQSIRLAGTGGAGMVELNGRAYSQTLDTAGDVVQKTHQAQGYIKQTVLANSGHVASGVVELAGELASTHRHLGGQVEAFGERQKASFKGAVFDFYAGAYSVGGLFSSDMRERAEALSQASVFVRQEGQEKSRVAIERSATQAGQIREGAGLVANAVTAQAKTTGQALRDGHHHAGATINTVMDTAANSVQNISQSIADVVRKHAALSGEVARMAVQSHGAVLSNGLVSGANEVKRVNAVMSDAVTNPRSAEGPASKLSGPGLADLGHPKHGLYVQAHAKLESLGASAGFGSHQELDNVAGTLVAQASKEGLNKIDRAFPSVDGKRFFAIEGDTANPAHHRVQVDATQAKQQTLEQSTQQVNQALQQAPDAQQQQSQGVRR